MKLSKKQLFFVCALFLVFFSLFLKKNEPGYTRVKQILSSIPASDRQILTDCFQELIENNCFGYTLFGNKPISFESYPNRLPRSISDFLAKRSDFFLNKGEKVWKKHEKLLPSKNFSLIFHEEEEFNTVYLINIPALFNAVQVHHALFQEVLGPEMDAETLLNSLKHSKQGLSSLLQGDVALEGILLGFGKQNALLYKRFHELNCALHQKKPPPFENSDDILDDSYSVEDRVEEKINKNRTFPVGVNFVPTIVGEGFTHILEEYKWYDKKLENGLHLIPSRAFDRFRFPYFGLDDSEESVQLVSEYLCVREELSKKYASGDFLEVTLKKFLEY